MKKDGKKYRRNWVSAVCYGLAAAMLIYVCYQVGSTVKTINEYYAQYGMSAQPIEYVTYCLQSALQPIVYTVVFFMCGYILDEVRKNNKAYYLTDEELVELAAAKREAREAKKFAKGEKAAAKAGYVAPDENSVEADFAKSLDAELKAEEKKVEVKAESKPEFKAENKTEFKFEDKPENKGENKKPYNNYNKSNQNRQGGSKPNQNRNKSEGGNKSGNGGNKNGGQRRSNNRKPKMEDASKAKADDGFEVVINEKDN